MTTDTPAGLVDRLPEMLAAAGAEGKTFGPASVLLCQAAPTLAQTVIDQADRIAALEKELAEMTRLEAAACKRLAEYNADLQAAETFRDNALKVLAGLLQHACIADAAPEDVDEEDRALERAARRLLTQSTKDTGHE